MIINGNVLQAEDGMWLTNGNTFGTVVRLSELDSASNWHEITDAEAQALQEVGDTDG